ncbi:MAG: 1-acyl-sn-glycerol-3-phosphate acyltransferase [Clostridia bacterium]|nr:1-acyl-sn-glycerol-3-phosphate acyltransferase [Clostridia bacterium]
MKIKVKKLTYEEVLKLPAPKHKNPKRPGAFFRFLIRALGSADLKATNFSYEIDPAVKVLEKTPCLILMNHSAFIDLEIAAKIFKDRPYCIVCTSDGFVGKEGLMRAIGCIPTKKFVTDPALIADMRYALSRLGTSVLMYPEASYSFDGRATALPRRMGLLFKRLDVPVIMVTTTGAFARDPLYNCLQKRRVNVSAKAELLLSREQVKEKSVEEIDEILDAAFSFDSFAWQQKNGVEINESFRADGLERILYKCPACGAEGKTHGKGITLTCAACGKVYTLDTKGFMRGDGGKTEFAHIPDWYTWERECVKNQLQNGSYKIDAPVQIYVMKDYKAVYDIGSGRLIHTPEGFTLTGAQGKLNYTQPPTACYGLYADYFWYEIGDVICIGNRDMLYYCFPNDVPVAKARLAAEELYKMKKAQKHATNSNN